MLDLRVFRQAIDPRAPATGNVHCPVHDDDHPSLRVWQYGGKLCWKCMAGCDHALVTDAIRTRAGELLNGHDGGARQGFDTTYSYRDANGDEIARVKRTDLPNGEKKFAQCRPDGKGGWEWKAPMVPRPLYGLDMLAARPDAAVLICEGEKAAHAARRLVADTFVVMTWMGGVDGVPYADVAPLRGRDCIVWPDNDARGQNAVVALASRLHGVAESVRILRVDDLPTKADAADVQWTVEEILSRCELAASGAESEPSSIDAAVDLDRLPLIFVNDIGEESFHVPQLVEDVLTKGGLSVAYGPSNSGKSYLTLYQDAAIARGVPWLSKRTIRGAVIYVAGEGAASIKMRIAAYKRHFAINDFPLAVVPVACNLLDPHADTRRVIDAALRTADRFNLPVTKITIDTLARALTGGNENASEDMGAVIANADRIRLQTGAHVLFVHHSGKDESKGSRGHSSLRAATDTEIEVSANGDGVHTIEVVKQRDLGSLGLRLSARFVAMPFGFDEWGKPRTVCVVQDMDVAAPRPIATRGIGKHQRTLLDALRANGPMVRTEAYAFMKTAGIQKRRHFEVIDSLLSATIIVDTPAGLAVKQ